MLVDLSFASLPGNLSVLLMVVCLKKKKKHKKLSIAIVLLYDN